MGLGLLSTVQMASPVFIGSTRATQHELAQRNLTMTLFPDLFQQNDLNQAISLVPYIQANWKFIMEY